ncbi:cysteine--tRNA ligase, partial [Candidatus Bathyarchaeota archaeon]
EVEAEKKKFEEAMDDDFNTPLAISALFSIARLVNNYLNVNKTIEKAAKRRVLRVFINLLGVLGIEWAKDKRETRTDELFKGILELLIDVRNELRRMKKWEIADRIRDDLGKMGIILEDAGKETKWMIKSENL